MTDVHFEVRKNFHSFTKGVKMLFVIVKMLVSKVLKNC